MSLTRPHQPPRLSDLIAVVDNAPLSFPQDDTTYYRLLLSPDPRPHGFIHPSTIARMPWPASFAVDYTARSVTLCAAPAGTSLSEHANAAFQKAVDDAIAADVFPVLAGRHSEHFRVPGARGFVQVERYAASLFGIAARGAHLTGYVEDPVGGGLRIWVARRSASLFMFPGMLDSTVAGGVKAADTPLSCILAESLEEASLPPSILPRIRPAGVITALTRDAAAGHVHGEVLHVYDLAMAPGEVPAPGDDEVAEFVLMDCAEVRRRMLAGEFKPNVCSVLVDFMVRRGIVTPETEGEGEYVEICTRLRRRLPMPTESDVPFESPTC
ncbi:hypothetical protein S40293_07446 [Stachybotrys chartarum IBT 40293]|nr:hypothetical protein S40293_07446 [Stachybotrys chartarum IBT 40293]